MLSDTKKISSIEELAESLFCKDLNGRVRLEYPFVFLCCIVGLLTNAIRLRLRK